MLKSFQTKLTLFFTALFLLLQGAAYFTVQEAIVRNIFDQSRDQLVAANLIFGNRIQATVQSLAEGAQILASDFGFRTAVATNDNPTILSALNNLGARIEADRVMLINLGYETIADTGNPDGEVSDFPFYDLIDRAEEAGRAESFTVLDGVIYEFVVTPVLAPVPIAWIAIGVEIDGQFARDFRRESTLPLDVTFAVGHAVGDWAVTASTLPEAARLELPGALAAEDEYLGEAPATITLDNSDYVTLVERLQTPKESPVVNAILQYSLDSALVPYQPLFVVLTGLAATALLVSLVGSIAIARGVTKPIRILDHAARRIQAGTYTDKIEVNHSDEIGRLGETFNQMMDGIAEREARIEHQALHDAATGLPNRAYFERRLGGLIANGGTTPLTVLLIEIGRVSEINYTLGHETGEDLIRVIGERLSSMIKQGDMVARHSSTMFSILMPGAAANAVKPIVDRILRSFEDPVPIAGIHLDVTAAIGEACYPDHGQDARTLLQRADTAIYEAKASSRLFATYDAEADPHKPERLTMMGELRKGLDRGEFKFYYQPKVDIAAQKITHVEALVRWIHPERGFMSPDDFIPLAEQTGNIQKLSEWALKTAISQAKAWQDEGLDIIIAVNLSARDLTNRKLPQQIDDLLLHHGVAANKLVLEITESAIMEDRSNAMAVLTALHNAGHTLSIDDYGTGYSSMAYLKALPVQEIKIDKSFVLNLASNKEDEILVRSTIDLGHNLGLKVTAEGIENEESLNILHKYGCDTGQGYFISKPVSADEIVAFYKDSRWAPNNNV
ncbi:MAG: EAL domain-containing protein [Rhodospirillaceae bacterium]